MTASTKGKTELEYVSSSISIDIEKHCEDLSFQEKVEAKRAVEPKEKT